MNINVENYRWFLDSLTVWGFAFGREIEVQKLVLQLKFIRMTRPEISLPIFIYNPDLILRNKFSPAKHLQAFP
jgi:hypothetical protein